jgi:regulator of protease activity HflC (stomatin/prohibitin superfamily)
MEYVITFAIIAFLLFFIYCLRRVTILEYEKGLKYSKGRFKGVLGAGSYWICRYWTAVTKVDVRPRFVSITGQEVPSSDGVTLKVSIAAKYEIEQPDVAVNKVQSYEEALYLELQLALRGIISATKIDELLEKRSEFGERLMLLAADKAQQLGLRLLSVDIKDIMLPGQLKQIFSQVVKARKEGLAALERARGESAALRNLANAARVMQENPALMQLRLLQSLGESTGNTLVLGMPTGSTPLPVKAKETGESRVEQVQPPEQEE